MFDHDFLVALVTLAFAAIATFVFLAILVGVMYA